MSRNVPTVKHYQHDLPHMGKENPPKFTKIPENSALSLTVIYIYSESSRLHNSVMHGPLNTKHVPKYLHSV